MALLQFKPAPMYILDEVDAALDLSHTQNIGRLIKTRFKGSQFIVVSLKDGMFQSDLQDEICGWDFSGAGPDKCGFQVSVWFWYWAFHFSGHRQELYIYGIWESELGMSSWCGGTGNLLGLNDCTNCYEMLLYPLQLVLYLVTKPYP
jgi:hypothetical protein